MATGYVYHEQFLKHEATGHPESPDRLQAIIIQLQREGLLSQLTSVSAVEAQEEHLLQVHSREMIERLEGAEGKLTAWLDPDTYVTPESSRIARLAAGGGIQLVSEIQEGRIHNGMALLRPPGHHATSTRSMGFCLLNNVAISARYLQRQYDLSRIAIIDWDVHHGNGTQEIFYRDGSVFYFSTHLFPHYPGSGSTEEKGEGEGLGTTLNIPLPKGFSREEYLEIFEEGLQVIHKFQPEFILISAGFDSHAEDYLGGLLLLEEDFAQMTKMVRQLADNCCQGRVASFLEGGYNLEKLASCVSSHLTVLIEEGRGIR
jgi:acetoin utilization deacetylase AcuC-like enzyme